MSYLIDGNNLIGQSARWRKSGTNARRVLLDELSAFAARRRVRIAVVFDGAPERFFADGSSYKGIQIRYAHRGGNADARIKELAESARERRTLIVVTSDRALADYVRACGAKVMSAKEFQARLVETENSENTAKRDERVASKDVDEWMRYFGVAPEDD